MRKLFLMTVSATMILAAAAFCMQQTNGSIHSLFQIHTEAQADDGGETPPITEEEEEEGPGNGGGSTNLIKGRSMEQVYYTSSFEAYLTYPWTLGLIVNVSSAFCCVAHNEFTYCDKNGEFSICRYLKYK